jgi:hypothetical protein
MKWGRAKWGKPTAPPPVDGVQRRAIGSVRQREDGSVYIVATRRGYVFLWCMAVNG